ncbi:MAG: phosphoribosylanthranilate isomerase [Cyclobacteriaceae bacterium]
MKESANIEEVSALTPDYMGFIFYENTPRFVGREFSLPNNFPSSIKRVGVFVNESIAVILEKVKRFRLDFVQLHGDESVGLCNKLNHEGISVIKVFRVNDDFDFATTTEFEDVSEYFLFDTRGKQYGGNSERFNWHALKNFNQKVPFFLSGGIGPESIEEILQLKNLNLHAIDVNSGVELYPGKKDKNKVSLIINKLRV